jgi:hypothetical protein
MGADKVIQNLESRNSSLQNTIKKLIADIEKQQNTVAKQFPVKDGDSVKVGGHGTFSMNRKTVDNEKKDYSYTAATDQDSNEDKDSLSSIQIRLGVVQQKAYAEQSAILTYCSAIMNEAKWGLAQDRRIFAQAVAFSPKHEAYAQAVGDEAQGLTEAYFERAELFA